MKSSLHCRITVGLLSGLLFLIGFTSWDISAGQADHRAKEPPVQEQQKSPNTVEQPDDFFGPVQIINTVIYVDISEDGIATVREMIDSFGYGTINKSFPDAYPYLFFFRRNIPFRIFEVKRNSTVVPHAGVIGQWRTFYTFGSASFITERKGPPSNAEKGRYRFNLLYKTGLDIAFGEKKDIILWDINSDEMITKASVIIRVSGNPPLELVRQAVPTYVFSLWEHMNPVKDRLSSRMTPEGLEVTTTESIDPGERLTFWIAIPKGIIAKPAAEQLRRQFFGDNRGVLYSLAGLGVLLAYYAVVWFIYGRDPRQGVVMPIYAPPVGLSPAAMRFVNTLRFDGKCFASALISIAVKGHLSIEKKNGITVLRAGRNAAEELSSDERVVYSSLFSKGNEVTLGSEEAVAINRAARALNRYLKTTLQKTYLITNFRFFAIGMIISLIFVLLSGWWLSQDRGMGIFFVALCVSFTGFSSGVFFYVQFILRSLWGFLQARGRQKWEAAKELAGCLVFTPFIAVDLIIANFIVFVTSLSVILFVGIALLINIIFTSLLKAPNRECRKLRDRIDGFRVFLEATEKDRMNMLNPPEKTPELFTQNLPYALALSIEQRWAEGVAGAVAPELETLHFNDDVWSKLIAGDPDELYNFLKISIQEDQRTASQ